MHRIEPPKDVIHIIDTLTRNGYEAYAVGGCVRDSVMGRIPKDWDITTDACPESVKGLFKRSLDTGLRHGTVTVLIDQAAYEVTTFRIDGRYEDGRHPEYVEFTRRLEEDLKRRDFTINSIAWNPERGFVDLFGGISDIAAGIVRAVGDPAERFNEDALRMLRAIRFAARLGFVIEAGTFDAIRDNSSLIGKISAERIREELTGILTSDDPVKFGLLVDTGLLGHILERFGYFSVHGTDGLCLKAVSAVEADPCLRWTMLLRCIFLDLAVEEGIAVVDDILRKLKFSNRSIDRILRLLKHFDMQIGYGPGDVAKAVYTAGDDIFGDLLKAKRAYALACDTLCRNESTEYIDEIDKVYNALIASGRCMKLRDLALNGQDLIRIGFSEGSGIGSALLYLFDCVLKEPGMNRKEVLEKMALDYLSGSNKQADPADS